MNGLRKLPFSFVRYIKKAGPLKGPACLNLTPNEILYKPLEVQCEYKGYNEIIVFIVILELKNDRCAGAQQPA